MGKFDEFNKKVNLKELEKQQKEVREGSGSGDYPEVPAGTYKVKLEKLEVGETGSQSKTPGAPMLRAQFRNIEGQHKKQCLFMNRVLYTATPSDKWNTERAIAIAIGWLESLEPSEDIDLVFTGYDDFSELVLDVAEDVSELEYEVEYDPEAFNTIHIIDTFE